MSQAHGSSEIKQLHNKQRSVAQPFISTTKVRGPCESSNHGKLTKQTIRRSHSQPFSPRPLPTSWALTRDTNPGHPRQQLCPPGQRSSCSCQSTHQQMLTLLPHLRPSRHLLQSLWLKLALLSWDPEPFYISCKRDNDFMSS
jgi:hypothetical protein